MTIAGKRLAIMQPYYLPYIGYFQLIAAVDKFVIFDDVNFINKGWINRNRMLVHGEPHLFTVPLQAASQNRLICDIELEEGGYWRRKLQRTVEVNYRKAPCYQETMPLIEKIINCPHNLLSEYILFSIRQIMAHLGLPDNIESTTRIYGNRQLKGSARILDICHFEEARTYINAPGGTELYEHEHFAMNGVDLKFLNTKAPEYSQGNFEFVAGLSILDVLMFNGQINTLAMVKNSICVNDFILK